MRHSKKTEIENMVSYLTSLAPGKSYTVNTSTSVRVVVVKAVEVRVEVNKQDDASNENNHVYSSP